MMKALKYIPVLLLLTACGAPGGKTIADTTKIDSTAKIVVTDTPYFDKPVAIVVMPSERLIKIVKGKQEESSYDAVLDDNMFYLDESNHYLDSIKANKVKRESEGAVRFKTLSGQTYTMKLDTLFFGVMLFNGKDKPIMADMTALQGDYEKYMKK